MVSEDCHKKLTPTGQLKMTEIYSHGVLRVGSLKSSCQQGYSSSRGSGANPSGLQFPVAVGILSLPGSRPHPSKFCLSFHIVSLLYLSSLLYVSNSPLFFSYMDISLDLGPTPVIQTDLFLRSLI